MTPTQFLLRYPEFTTVDPYQVQLALDTATLVCGVAPWDKLLELGLSSLTAHYLAIRSRELAAGGDGATLGSVASESADSVAVSYATPATTNLDFEYAATSYGLRYLSLRRLLGLGGLVV